MKDRIKILIVDDHKIVRMGLTKLIELEHDMQVVGEASNGEEALRLAGEVKPDVMVIDLMMSQINGDEVIRRMSASDSRSMPKCLILTSFGESEGVAAALASGAIGAIVKGSSDEELSAAIRRTAKGLRTLSPEIEAAIAENADSTALSNRNLEVLRYAAKGLTNSEIAKLMEISLDGVKNHIKTILRKLDASNRGEAIAIAIKKHLVSI